MLLRRSMLRLVSGRSETYTHGHHESVLRSHRWRTADNSAAYLLDALRPGLSVLDVGCGPGTITRDLALRVHPGAVVGIDREEAPLGDARLLAAGVEGLRFELGDVYAIPAADASFDLVHAHQVLQHLTDPISALREMGRVCRPGGLVAARDVDFSTMTWYPSEPALDDWLALYQRVARANGAEPDAGRRLADWARRAGLGEPRASASAWCFSAAAERAWWGGLWAERTTRSSFADQALGYGLATEERLEAIAAGFRRWAGRAGGWWAVLHGEIRCRKETTP